MRLQDFPLWPSNRRPAHADADETLRARVIAGHGVERITDDPELERIVAFAAALCDVPTALVTIVERERQWFVARRGMDKRETPRPTSFCAYAMLGAEIFEIRDATQDPRFADNPLVIDDHLRFYAGAPLVSSEGVPLGALCVIDYNARPEGLTTLQRQGLEVLARAVMQRLTGARADKSASAALDEADRRLIALAEHIPVFAWSSDAEGKLDFANTAFYDYVGSRDPARIDLAALAHPDDAKAVGALREEARRKGEKWQANCRVRNAEGDYRWMTIRAWPLREGGDGPVIAWFGAAVDIDEIHRLSESQDILARELSHRIKNIFAVVSGLVSLRARGRDDLRDFAAELTEVFHALGRAHDYVRPLEGRKGDSLRELLRDLLAPYRHRGADPIVIEGDDVALGARAATPLALVFHELATNSAKYGALSERGGAVVIEIVRDGEDVTIDWTESGVPNPSEVSGTGEGFGTRLLTLSVERQLGGSFRREFRPDGLEVTLRLPQSAICG